MTTCHAAKNKDTLHSLPHCSSLPAKTTTKNPTPHRAGIQQGNPSSSLQVVTGGKTQDKPVVKNGAVVFSTDKIEAKPNPAKTPVKNSKARALIDDFGMIKIAKTSSEGMKRSIWGTSRIPTLSTAKHSKPKR